MNLNGMKVYIAGKITNYPDYKNKFKEAEEYLQGLRYITMNPSVLPKGFEQEEYLKICFSMIDVCQAIYMLDNWYDSPGAKLEHEYALNSGKIVFYQNRIGGYDDKSRENCLFKKI